MAWMGHWNVSYSPSIYLERKSNNLIGLTNLNIWFGWSSIIEYISSNIWFNPGNFIFLRILEICIFALFFNILLFFLIQNKINFINTLL